MNDPLPIGVSEFFILAVASCLKPLLQVAYILHHKQEFKSFPY